MNLFSFLPSIDIRWNRIYNSMDGKRMEWWGKIVRKRIMSDMKYNRHFYLITHTQILLLQSTFYIRCYLSQKKKKKDLCCYFITILMVCKANQEKEKYFPFFWVRFSFKLNEISSPLHSLNVTLCQWQLWPHFGNVTLVISS